MIISTKEFIEAVKNGDTATVFNFVTQTTPHGVKFSEGRLALYTAAKYQHAEIFLLCLSCVAITDAKNWINRAIIHEVFGEQTTSVRFFHNAIFDNVEQMEGRDKHVINVNDFIDSEGDTLLIWAVRNKYYYFTHNLLIGLPLSIDFKNNKGESALSIAKASENAPLVDLLIKGSNGELGPLNDNHPLFLINDDEDKNTHEFRI